VGRIFDDTMEPVLSLKEVKSIICHCTCHEGILGGVEV